MKKLFPAAFLSFCLFLSLLAGCVSSTDPIVLPNIAAGPVGRSAQIPREDEDNKDNENVLEETPNIVLPAQPLGAGTVVCREDTAPLTAEQERPLYEYMNYFYESLARLELQPIGELFSNPEAAAINDISLSFQIDMRKLQEADYSLVSYNYTLSYSDVVAENDGNIYISALENNVQSFSQNPDIPAERYDIRHHFVLEQTDGVWLIKEHIQSDTLLSMIYDESDPQDTDEEDAWRKGLAVRYAESTPRFFAMIEESRTRLLAQKSLESETAAAEHDYDRDAAVAYAYEHADIRNRRWPDYSSYGGNCQNFASQCLLAGGIPMDPYGNYVWKWYSGGVSNTSGRSGRSSSWTGVTYFIRYAAGNSGSSFGLVAITDAPYFSGEPGDLIHLGTSDGWMHTAVISSPVTDANGATIDYLVHSNTGDMRNYPVSLYGYSEFTLTKIVGWND